MAYAPKCTAYMSVAQAWGVVASANNDDGYTLSDAGLTFTLVQETKGVFRRPRSG